MEYTITPECHVDSYGNTQLIKWIGNNINSDDKSYFLRIELSGTSGSFTREASVDYKDIGLGDLFFKTNVGLDTIDFDVNENGELVVIGYDANRFYINDNGELVYVEPVDATVNVGLLSNNEDSVFILGLNNAGEIGKFIQLESDF